VARTRPTVEPPGIAAGRAGPGSSRRMVALVLLCYLLGAIAVTGHLWADPASHTVAGNPNDADLFAWFMRYAATAISHGRLPALVTTAMNAPQGVNLMWNTPVLLPGVLLTPVTLLLGPQVSLTVLMTAGFAGSAASMFYVLRRWQVSTSAAALAGLVYGFSPALLHSAIGHYSVQVAILPPLIIDAGLRLCAGSPAPVRAGVRLGLLVTAQLFTAEELLFSTAVAGVLLVLVLAAAQPQVALQRWRGAAAGLAAAAGVTLALAGPALSVQFFGRLTLHGSPFTPDYFKNDLTGFVVPSQYLLFHTAGSAAEAARFQGLAPEYLAYLGWPLIVVLVLAAIVFWRQPVVRALAVVAAVYELLSLGGHPLVGGTLHAGVTLPWLWFEGKPLIGAALPDRLSIIADGAAAAMLAFSIEEARSRLARAGRRWPSLVTAAAVAAVLPLLPLPLPAAAAAPLPAGWSAAIAELHLAPDARVLVVPVPTSRLTVTLRWQADTGQPGQLIGGYFIGPASNGQAYMEGNGVAVTAQYLNQLWSGGPPAGAIAVAMPTPAQVTADLDTWQPAAVIAVTSPGSPLGRYLVRLFRRPTVQAGNVIAWRR
jgi:hypothetical protein